MNELDLIIFQISHEPIIITEILKKINKEYNKKIARKTIYTSIYRLEKIGLVTKKNKGKNILIQQASIPVTSYLNTLIEDYPHLINKGILKGASLNILLTLFHSKNTAKCIADFTSISVRNIKRYLSKFHKLAIIKKQNKEKTTNEYVWEINKINAELMKFLEAYEEFRALKITKSIDTNAALIWLNGIEFLIKSQKNIQKSNFKKTGAAVLEKYGLKLLSADNFFFYTHRKLNIWDHAFLTVISRGQDPTQLRYLAYLYKKNIDDKDEFELKGSYYDKKAMNSVLNLINNKKESSELKSKYVEELERLYGG
ncbi:MAG: hypothetical protein U9R21_08570 [Candidatus Thermoplasmatota archaeon]|nr:hypothetical protein [Candidatus Thermoplasmatota archaeon]